MATLIVMRSPERLSPMLHRAPRAACARRPLVPSMLRLRVGDEHARRIWRGHEYAFPQRDARVDVHRVETGVGNQAAVSRAPAVDPHARDRGRIARGRRPDRDAHAVVPAIRRAASATCSLVKPKYLNSTPAGADSP